MERQEHGALVQAQRESFRSRATRDVAVRETDLKSSGRRSRSTSLTCTGRSAPTSHLLEVSLKYPPYSGKLEKVKRLERFP